MISPDSHMLTFLTSFRLLLKSHILLRASLTVLFNSENYSFLSGPLSLFTALFLFTILITLEQIFYSNLLCLLLPQSIRVNISWNYGFLLLYFWVPSANPVFDTQKSLNQLPLNEQTLKQFFEWCVVMVEAGLKQNEGYR